MTPFQQLRVWLRRASVGQRAMAGLAAVIAVGLLGWLVAPVDEGAGTDVLAGGLPTASPGATLPTGPVDPASTGATIPGSTGGVAGPATAAGGGAPTGGAVDPAAPVATDPAAGGGGQPQALACPPGTDQGASSREVRIAVTIINIAGAAGNSTVGVPTPDLQRRYWQLVADSINANGGAGCRSLALEFYDVNPIVASDAQQKCIQIANSRPFMAVDTGALTAVGASDCVPNQQIPMVAQGLSRAQLANYYPYYIAPGPIADDTIRNGVLALRDLGAFGADQGFQKLGLLFRSCLPDPISIFRNALREVGVPDDAVVAYDLGCPAGGQNSATELQQAALTFKQAGVTHVSHVGMGDFVVFTQSAAQQNFEPQYILVDDAIAGTQGGTAQPNAGNLDGAISITSNRYGEQSSPGYAPDGGTQACNAIFAAAGEPPVYQQQVGYGGLICAILGTVEAVLDRTPEMTRAALVQGMQGIGALNPSYPLGPVDFSAVPAGTPYGKPSWRTINYQAGCACWVVPDPGFRAGYP
jgi:hypothetical protein